MVLTNNRLDGNNDYKVLGCLLCTLCKTVLSRCNVIAIVQTSVQKVSLLPIIKCENEYTFMKTINFAIITMSLAKIFDVKGQMLIGINHAALERHICMAQS